MIKIINKKGFTLLFASLIVSLLLSVGLAILNITLQQLLLSSAAKESQFAFYNADTGIECALFYDKNGPNGDVFATSSESTGLLSNGDITCNNFHPSSGPTVDPSTLTSTHADTDFYIVYDTTQCIALNSATFHIKVTKDLYTDPISGQSNTLTTVRSYGYNTCDVSNARRVERGLLVNY